LTQRFSPEQLAPVLERLLHDPVAGGSTAEALASFQELFGVTGGSGIAMASTALRTAMPAERVRALFLAYAQALSTLTAEASTRIG